MIASSPCPRDETEMSCPLVEPEISVTTDGSKRESQNISPKCEQPKEIQHLQGTLDNRYLDAGTSCSLLTKKTNRAKKYSWWAERTSILS